VFILERIILTNEIFVKIILSKMNTTNNSSFVSYEANCLKLQIDCGCFDNMQIFSSEEEKINESSRLLQISNVSSYYDCKVFAENAKLKEMVLKKLSGKNEANTAPPCPRCGSDRYSISAQRRSADEPMNHEIHCPTCNNIEFK